MRLHLKTLSLFLLVCFVVMTIAACGEQTSANAKNVDIPSHWQQIQTTVIVANTPAIASKSTPAPTASPTSTPTPFPTSTPTPAQEPSPTSTPTPAQEPSPTPVPTLTVNWSSNAATIYAVGAANIRSAPDTTSLIVGTVVQGQALTAYGTINGEILSAGAVWYRVSAQGSAPEYIYSELVNTSKPLAASATTRPGKVIKVDLTTQQVDAYDDGTLVHENLMTSGQPGLLTPTGTFSIISKLHPTVFYSPWGKDSPYYYAPLNIDYALGFQGTLLFLHDAPWRGNDFGPGTQVPHTAANGAQMTGSHGCVEMSNADAEWLYNWAPIGTPLIIAY